MLDEKRSGNASEPTEGSSRNIDGLISAGAHSPVLTTGGSRITKDPLRLATLLVDRLPGLLGVRLAARDEERDPGFVPRGLLSRLRCGQTAERRLSLPNTEWEAADMGSCCWLVRDLVGAADCARNSLPSSDIARSNGSGIAKSSIDKGGP